jgi:polysaccharide biosynthesis protein PslH
MRTLHLTTELPYPAASGGAIRVNGIIEGLHKAGHDVTVICFHEGDASEVPDYINIETVPLITRTKRQRINTLLFTQTADIALRLYSDKFATRLRELLIHQQFDLVQFEGIEMVCYLPIVKQAQPDAKLCFDTFNAEFALQDTIYRIDRGKIKRWPAALYSWLQVGRIKRFEGRMCRLADMVVAVSPEDATSLQPFRPDQRIHIIPNGIHVGDFMDTSTSLLVGAQHAESLLSSPIEHNNALVFTGKMDYRPNIDAMLWFTESILPHIKRDMPDVNLYIVGQKPHARLEHLTTTDNVHITGWVDSVAPYLQNATVYIAPLRMGSGTRLKLLGAMAAGCAIVATTTACAGLLDEAKQAMIIIDDEKQMAEKIVTLLNNPSQRGQMGKIAREKVEQYYDWSVLIPRLLDAYKEIGLGV